MQSIPLILAACAMLPPVGLILLWMRPRTRLSFRLLGSVAAALFTVAHLVAWFGLRIELSGSGSKPIFSFHKPEKHYEEIERNRAQQAKWSPAEASAAAGTRASLEPAGNGPAAPAPAPISRGPAYWTAFRGPNRDGFYPLPVLTEWPAQGLEVVWKQPIGGGYASVVFGEGKLYTIEQRRDREVVAAYDVRTGREHWTHAYPAFFQESMGGDGPRATPTYHDGVVYSLGAAGELAAVAAATGKLLWRKNILEESGATNVQWGMCGAPLVVDGTVVVQPGGSKGNSVVAYDRRTGAKVWGALDDRQAYVSPMLVDLAGRRQIVTVTASRAVGLDPGTGKLLWEFPWVTQYDVNGAQPVPAGANRLLLSSGYGHGAALIEIGEGGAKEIWQNNRLKNRFNSSVIHDGYVYGFDESILACLRVEDGTLMWKGGRYGYGQLVLASGHLIVLSEEGDLVLVKATPERHTEVARFGVLSGKTWNVPAIEDGMLIVRNTTEMACLRIGKK